MSIYASILTGGSNNHQTTSEEANYTFTDFVSEGVVGAITNTAGVAPATGAFAVNAQGSPNMTVAVSSGVGYVQATPSGQAAQTLRIYNNASANVTIAANASGSTKYDWIYISVSAANAATPNAAGDNVATLVASRSTSATADDGTPPTYGYPLAIVTVANAASSIANGNIQDIRAIASTANVGQLMQSVSTAYTAVATGTTIIPHDDTIPQISEGTEFMTQIITPHASTNIIIVTAVIVLANSAVNQYKIAAMFQDSTANAIAAEVLYSADANGDVTITLRYRGTAGTTLPTTYRVRGGSPAAGTTTFNGASGARIFGAITKSTIEVAEYRAA